MVVVGVVINLVPVVVGHVEVVVVVFEVIQ
jgi:hypothetical protein